MPRRQRLAVALLFAMGMIVTVAGIVRTWFIYKSLITTYDNTWYVPFVQAFNPAMLIVTQVRLPSMDCCRGRDRFGCHMCIGSSSQASSVQDPLQSLWDSVEWRISEEEV